MVGRSVGRSQSSDRVFSSRRLRRRRPSARPRTCPPRPSSSVPPSVCLIRGHAAETNGSKAQAPSTTDPPTHIERPILLLPPFPRSILSACMPVCMPSFLPSFTPSILPCLIRGEHGEVACLPYIPSSSLLARCLGGGTAKPKAACQATSRQEREGGSDQGGADIDRRIEGRERESS